jgi:hypothetical protein
MKYTLVLITLALGLNVYAEKSPVTLDCSAQKISGDEIVDFSVKTNAAKDQVIESIYAEGTSPTDGAETLTITKVEETPLYVSIEGKNDDGTKEISLQVYSRPVTGVYKTEMTLTIHTQDREGQPLTREVGAELKCGQI